MKILILDDQPGLAHTLALSLRMAGYAAFGFTQPSEVLATIQKNDVLVTDYHLPEMTGLEVAQSAYAQGWRGGLLLMSGHSVATSETMSQPLPRFILRKPFPTQTLIEALPRPV